MTTPDPTQQPPPNRGWRRRPVLVAVGAVLLVAVAVGIGVAAWSDHGASSSAPATQRAMDVGWRLVTLQEGSHTFAAARGRPAITFYRDGRYSAKDGINYLSGRYETTPAGFVMNTPSATFNGYGGSDPAVLATQSAFLALTSRNYATRASIENGELVLSVANYRLTFRDAGSAAELPLPRR